MKLTRCMHNHYYDGSKYSKCPHCVEKGFITSDEIIPDQENPRFHGYDYDKSVKDNLSFVSIHQQISDTPLTEYGNSDTKTSDLINGINIPSDIVVLPQNDMKKDLDNSFSIGSTNSEISAVNDNSDDLLEGMLAKEAEDNNSLQSEISSVRLSVGQDSKTVAFYDIEATEPTVGWLIALNGAYVGESFNLKAGRNNIGRWTKMDVALPQEASVSRDRHAILTYDPVGRKFFIQPGEGNALVYKNDEILLIPSLINDSDTIKLGECKLLFKALCGESFTWDTYLKGDK